MMSQKSGGNKNFEQRLAEIKALTDEYENGIPNTGDYGLGIPKLKFDQQKIDMYFNLHKDTIANFDAEECSAVAYELSRYAMYIQRERNIESGNLKWCNAVSRDLVAAHWGDYDNWTKYEVRIDLISRTDDAARKLLKIRNAIEQKVERLNGIASHIKHLSDIMMENSRNKRYVNRQNYS